MIDFSINVDVGQACTQAPHDTHSDARKSVGPAEITEAKPRPSTVSANVPWTSSQARTQRELARSIGEGRARLAAGALTEAGQWLARAQKVAPHAPEVAELRQEIEREFKRLELVLEQVAAVEALEARGASRPLALHGMFARYLEHSAANEPVHSWPLPS